MQSMARSIQASISLAMGGTAPGIRKGIFGLA
jgi:hypothetical protein